MTQAAAAWLVSLISASHDAARRGKLTVQPVYSPARRFNFNERKK